MTKPNTHSELEGRKPRSDDARIWPRVSYEDTDWYVDGFGRAEGGDGYADLIRLPNREKGLELEHRRIGGVALEAVRRQLDAQNEELHKRIAAHEQDRKQNPWKYGPSITIDELSQPPSVDPNPTMQIDFNGLKQFIQEQAARQDDVPTKPL